MTYRKRWALSFSSTWPTHATGGARRTCRQGLAIVGFQEFDDLSRYASVAALRDGFLKAYSEAPVRRAEVYGRSLPGPEVRASPRHRPDCSGVD